MSDIDELVAAMAKMGEQAQIIIDELTPAVTQMGIAMRGVAVAFYNGYKDAFAQAGFEDDGLRAVVTDNGIELTERGRQAE